MAQAGKTFKLEQVLVFRREMEKLRKQEFASAQDELYQAHQELRHEEQLVEQLTRDFHQYQPKIACIDDIRMYADYFARKREDIRQQKEQIEVLDQIMDEKRADLMEASKDKKVLESLREKKAEEFRKEMATKERNFLDEISIRKKVQ